VTSKIACPYVCASVTLRYRDHIRLGSSKIILPFVSLGYLLSAECRPQPTSRIFSKGTLRNFVRNRGRVQKQWFSVFRLIKDLLSLKCGYNVTIEDQFEVTYALSNSIEPKSTTLDDLEGSLCTVFQNTCATVLLFIYF